MKVESLKLMSLKEAFEYILCRISPGEIDADWKLAEAVKKIEEFMDFLGW